MTPRQVVVRAVRLGLAGLGITDHDTIDGIAEAAQAGSELGVVIVPGVELSSARNGEEIHLIAYCPDREHPEFGRMLVWYRQTRRARLLKILDSLSAMGIAVVELAVRIEKEERCWGRPHVAAELVRLGVASSVHDAFGRFLGRGGAAYVAREWLEPETVLEWIHRCGGVAVLAHPGRLCGGFVRRLIGLGLDGLEVYHPDHDPGIRSELLALANEFGLLVTGGSDFHGPGMGKYGDLGNFVMPVSVVDDLKVRSELIRRARAPGDRDRAGR